MSPNATLPNQVGSVFAQSCDQDFCCAALLLQPFQGEFYRGRVPLDITSHAVETFFGETSLNLSNPRQGHRLTSRLVQLNVSV